MFFFQKALRFWLAWRGGAEELPPRPEYRVIARSVQGRRHVDREVPCQDANAFKVLPEGALVAAVADGAGTASQAEVGAAQAADAAVAALSERSPDWPEENSGWERLLTGTLRAARAAVEEAAEEREVAVRELASTLIALVATPEVVAVGHVGDGTAVLFRNDAEQTLTALTTPQKGLYANETVFLVSPDALEQAQLRVWHGHALGVAVCTDGLEEMALDAKEGAPREAFLLPFFQYAARVEDPAEGSEKLGRFLQSPKIADRTHDDVTLMIATTQTSKS